MTTTYDDKPRRLTIDLPADFTDVEIVVRDPSGYRIISVKAQNDGSVEMSENSIPFRGPPSGGSGYAYASGQTAFGSAGWYRGIAGAGGGGAGFSSSSTTFVSSGGGGSVGTGTTSAHGTGGPSLEDYRQMRASLRFDE